jgi:hypothetical protein
MDATVRDQADAMALIEVWASMFTRYLSVIGMVIVHYDCLLTIKDEVGRNPLPLRAIF